MLTFLKKIIFNKLPQIIKSIFCFKKGDGISICIRINDSKYFEYLFPQLAYIYDYADEFIIYYNSISSYEEKLLTDFCLEREKISLTKYSLINFDFVEYSNKMINSRNFDWCFLFDSDMLFSLDDLVILLNKIRNSKLNNVFFYSGINVYNNNISFGFSNQQPENKYSSFAGCGDFICFSSLCKNVYFDKDKLNINLNFIKKNYTGLIFLHLSPLCYLDKDFILADNLNLDLIKETMYKMKRPYKISSYSRKWYLRIIKNTKSEILNNLLIIYKNQFSSK